MTIDKFNQLAVDASKELLDLITEYDVIIQETVENTVRSRTVRINVERSLIPPEIATAEILEWVTSNAAAGITMTYDLVERVSGGMLGGRWTWVHRIRHIDATVTVLNAGDQ